jgi:hypothetical protein
MRSANDATYAARLATADEYHPGMNPTTLNATLCKV